MGSVRLARYTTQCYVDLCCEPRWLAEFAMPRQLKYEIGGRVLGAATRDEKAIDRLGLRDILISDAPHSLKKQLNLVLAQLPGPLEGNLHTVNQLQPDILNKIRKDLINPSPSVSSFTRMANAGLFFRLPEDIPTLAADAIRRAQYLIDSRGKSKVLRDCLVGLAIGAAINRSHQLADELFVVIRSYRRFLRDALDVYAAFRIGMVACASRTDRGDWCKCVGALIADLGFGELTRGEATALHVVVTDLCNIVPELWAASAQGIAAIEAVGFS